MKAIANNSTMHMVWPACPECGRSCEVVDLAGYRTWCADCFNTHVARLPMPDGACRLEKDSRGVWQWVEVAP
jgi:NMD protein affecting ribosome stability and mRNA decay